jgi:hypothetical protein
MKLSDLDVRAILEALMLCARVDSRQQLLPRQNMSSTI